MSEKRPKDGFASDEPAPIPVPRKPMVNTAALLAEARLILESLALRKWMAEDEELRKLLANADGWVKVSTMAKRLDVSENYLRKILSRPEKNGLEHGLHYLKPSEGVVRLHGLHFETWMVARGGGR